MPYLFLILGLLIGLYAAYRFFINADVHQVKALFLSAALITFCLALFYLAVTGRLIAALGLVIGILPFGIQYLRHKYRKDKDIIDVTPVEEDDDPA